MLRAFACLLAVALAAPAHAMSDATAQQVVQLEAAIAVEDALVTTLSAAAQVPGNQIQSVNIQFTAAPGFTASAPILLSRTIDPTTSAGVLMGLVSVVQADIAAKRATLAGLCVSGGC